MKKRITVFVLVLLSNVYTSFCQFYPHNDSTDYREDYRGQYHFSPKSEWMNDINGLVYHGEKYHMIYQWGKKIRHGGYATSPDLLHWEDKGVALIPQNTFLPANAIPNVSGAQVYSGSAVVVSNETARKITGTDKEAIIAIYTGTKVGTCLAWSNDNGETWHNYQNNPVAHPTNGAVPRDPCVIWHEASEKWVLAIYESINNKNYTAFYGSKDLINWDFLSKIEFGYECPDLIELPVDRDKNNKKWVLYDANGSYIIGDFDGEQFVRESKGKPLRMDVGPDFYAAQTFPMGNLPNNDNRTIQIAWMDRWNGGIGEKGWERNATFPVSLGLVTHDGEIKLTRNPIKEISLIHEKSKTWSSQIIQPGNNLLEGINSKKFELSLKVDLNESTALNFGVKVANKYIIYDLHNKTLLSKKLIPDNSNQLHIRILVDWGQLEIFGNYGIFSYSEQFAFSPDHDDIQLFSDGDIKLISMEFHELARIW